MSDVPVRCPYCASVLTPATDVRKPYDTLSNCSRCGYFAGSIDGLLIESGVHGQPNRMTPWRPT